MPQSYEEAVVIQDLFEKFEKLQKFLKDELGLSLPQSLRLLGITVNVAMLEYDKSARGIKFAIWLKVLADHLYDDEIN